MDNYCMYGMCGRLFCRKLATVYPFPLADAFAADIVVKGEIVHDEQFTLPQCFQLYFMIKLSFMEIFRIFANMFSKSSAAEL